MGRMLPVECEHGVVLDWGDFGPCQDCGQHDEDDCPNHASCDVCLPEHPPQPLIRRVVVRFAEAFWARQMRREER